MELKPQTISQWAPTALPAPLAPDAARAVLLFGPDQGGVFEFGRLAAGTGDCERMDARSFDIHDALSALGSGALFGGGTTIVLDGATDTQAAKIDTLLEAPFAPGARLIVLAGDLKATSKLRKRFQGGSDLIGVPLYLMRDAELLNFAKAHLRAAGFTLEAEAARALGQRLSGDRALAARACEIIALHAEGAGRKTISLADIRIMLDPVDEDGMVAPLDHALAGQPGPAAAALQSRLAGGESFVALLRVFAQRCHRLREMLSSGLSPREAVAKAKPPVFWTERDRTIQLLSKLTIARLDRMLEMFDRIEYRIIEQGVPEATAMGMLLIEISHHSAWKATT